MFIGYAGIAVLCYVSYLILTWLAAVFVKIDPGIGAAIVVGALTIISSVYVASFNSRKAREQVAFEAQRGEKAQIYDEFVKMVVQVVKNTKAGKKGEDVLPGNIEEFFHEFTSKLIVYGGPGVVQAFAKWRSSASETQGTGQLMLIDKLLREMRSDLGESNKGLDDNELVGLFTTGGKS